MGLAVAVVDGAACTGRQMERGTPRNLRVCPSPRYFRLLSLAPSPGWWQFRQVESARPSWLAGIPVPPGAPTPAPPTVWQRVHCSRPWVGCGTAGGWAAAVG